VCATLAACDRPGVETEGESGQLEGQGANLEGQGPAQQRDMSATKGAPDSTTGIAEPVGRGSVSGDSTGREEQTQSPPANPGN
jgi:hypothetical protein